MIRQIMGLVLSVCAVMTVLTGCGNTATEASKELSVNRESEISTPPEESSQYSEAAEKYRQISQEEASTIMQEQSGYQIVDVRTVQEYEEGHIPGAICISNESIINEPPPELADKSQLLLIYCRSGRRSKEASEKLANMGYTNIMEFGGIITWTGPLTTD